MEKLVLAASIAVFGWIITHFSKLYFDKRNAQLNRINEQLEKLYGPLMATLIASHETWLSFSKKHWPSHGMQGYFGKGDDKLSGIELERWRTWVKNVFHPLNERVEKIIIENTHLIEGDEIPGSFTKALSHVSAYRAVIAQWEKDDFSEHLSVNNWPSKDLKASVEPIFNSLTQEQSKLLGKKI